MEDKKVEKQPSPAKRNRKKRLYWIIGILILFSGFSYGSIEITSRSSFCKSCHYMVPYYENWSTSKHGKVECIQCHFEPGIKSAIRGKMEGLVQVVSYISQSYKKRRPWPEIADESCLRSGCHQERSFEATTFPFKGVQYSHQHHLGELRRGKKLRCTSCHAQIVQGPHMKVSESTCFLCHFKKSEAPNSEHLRECELCHDEADNPQHPINAKFSHVDSVKRQVACGTCHGEMVFGDGKVPVENCYSCHWDRHRNEKYSDTQLVHSVHVTQHRVKCIRCHLTIEHRKPKTEELKPDCVTCHTSVHNTEVQMYYGQGGDGVKPVQGIKSKHFIGCQGCHTKSTERPDGTLSKVGSQQSCERCHVPGFSRVMAWWKNAADSKAGRYQEYLTTLQPALDKLQDPAVKAQTDGPRNRLTHNLNLVRRGRCVHNIGFSDALLASMANDLEALSLLAKDKETASSIDQEKFHVNDACMPCHYGAEEMSVASKDYLVEDKPFPHRRHTALECTECHQVEVDYRQTGHGKMKAPSDKLCKECH